jgi:hypothetical protein
LFADGALAWLGGIGDSQTACPLPVRAGPWPAFGDASPDAHGFIVPSHAGSVLSYLRERRAEFRIVGLEWVLGRAGGVMDGLRVVWFFFRMGAVVAAKQQ